MPLDPVACEFMFKVLGVLSGDAQVDEDTGMLKQLGNRVYDTLDRRRFTNCGQAEESLFFQVRPCKHRWCRVCGHSQRRSWPQRGQEHPKLYSAISKEVRYLPPGAKFVLVV